MKEWIKEIQHRAEKATPAPWAWSDDVLISPESDAYLVAKPYYDDDAGEVSLVVFDSDAEFIAHSREDIPRLIAEVKRLTARAEKAERERDAAIADMESLMWHSGDGCTICAHAVKDTRVDYSKYDCGLGGAVSCQPKWRGLEEQE